MKRSGGLDAQKRKGDARRPEKTSEQPRRQAGRHRLETGEEADMSALTEL